MTRCTSLTVTGIDSDSDGLDDECEYQIASKFAPRLIFEANDYARGRETYWASHRKYACGGWYTTDGLHAYCSGYIWVIRVAYLLGYYSDGGPQAHKGDSEFLILEAAYIPSEDKWKTSRVWMTAHYGSDPSDNSRWWYWSQLEYPVTENGLPNIWVSQGKHANYPTESDCDSGGFFFSDFCDRDVTESVGILRGRNLGELNAKLVNCTFSAIPSQHPGQECFWTEQYFDGWWGGFTDYTAGYGGHLGQFMSQPNGWDTSVL